MARLKVQSQARGGRDRIDQLLEAEKQIGGQLIDIYRITLDVLKKGIISGAANVPLSLRSLQGFEDLLHGGAYSIPATQLPYYSPGVQAQITWQISTVGSILSAVLAVPTTVDINPTWSMNPLGGINVEHPHPTWVALPPGAKPEQAEIIIDSAVPHLLPKILSDQEYYLAKEWDSLFFTLNLATGISTNVRTLVQAGESVIGGREEILTGKSQRSIAEAEAGLE